MLSGRRHIMSHKLNRCTLSSDYYTKFGTIPRDRESTENFQTDIALIFDSLESIHLRPKQLVQHSQLLVSTSKQQNPCPLPKNCMEWMENPDPLLVCLVSGIFSGSDGLREACRGQKEKTEKCRGQDVAIERGGVRDQNLDSGCSCGGFP